jgi:hypothetical protein
MTPTEFCQQAMLEYERQWTAAAGHQERHPLRVKMQALESLMAEAGDTAQFTHLMAEGCTSGDPFRELLCNELLPRWERALQSSTSG